MSPILCMLCHDDVQVLFNPLILSFRESISLRVESRRKILLDPEFSGQSSSKVRGEAWVSVRYNFVWQSKPLVDMIQIELCNAWASNRSGTW
jgi:hypothetical protein